MTEEKTNEVEKDLPISLDVVFWLFYALGAYAIYKAVMGLFSGTLNLDIYLLLIPCANGLGALNNRWRIASIVIVIVGLFLYSIAGWAAVASDGPLDLVTIAGIALGFSLSLAVYVILVREDTAVLFREGTNKQKQTDK